MSQGQNFSKLAMAGDPFTTKISGGYSVSLGQNGPDEFYGYGPKTAGTTTGGLQEALNNVPTRGTIIVDPLYNAAKGLSTTMKTPASIVAFANPNDATSDTASTNITPQLGNLTIKPNTGTVFLNTILQGISLDSLTLDTTNTNLRRTILRDVNIYSNTANTSPITITGGNLNDYTVLDHCDVEYNAASALTNGLFNLTSTNQINQFWIRGGTILRLKDTGVAGGDVLFNGNGAAGIIQVLMEGVDIEINAPAAGENVFFLQNVANYFKQIDWRGGHIELINTTGATTTLFKIVNADLLTVLDWFMDIPLGGNNTPTLLNLNTGVTFSSVSNRNAIILKGYVSGSSGQPTLSQGALSTFPVSVQLELIVDIKHKATSGFSVTTPAVPAAATNVQNTTSRPVIVYWTTTAASTATVTDRQGTAVALQASAANQANDHILQPFEQIQFSSVTGFAWKWYGI